MLSSIALPNSRYKSEELDVGGVGGEKVVGGRSLSLTLQKLYIWEKKLYNEVKVCIYFTCNIFNLVFVQVMPEFALFCICDCSSTL
jgi:hypothetical protein